MIQRHALTMIFGLFALTTLAANNAQATLLAYESFNYPSGTLNGKGPGNVGFIGTWNSGLASYVVQSGNLAYPPGTNLPVEGNRANLTGGAGTIRQSMSNPINFGNNGTYYVSFLIEKNANLSTANEFFWLTLNNSGDSSAKVALGLGSTESMLLGNTTAAFSATATNYYSTNQTYLYLAKIVTNSTGNDQYFAKMINTSTGTVPLTEPVWDLTHSFNGSGIADRLELGVGSLSNHTIDAIRIADNFFDATQIFIPAPEPSTCTLLALGMLAVAMKRRRVRQAAGQI